VFRRTSKSESTGPRGEPLPPANEGLPDSHMPSGLCPRCGKQSSFDIAGSLPVTADGSYVMERNGTQTPMYQDRVTSLICRHCHQGVVVVEEQWVGDQPRGKQSGGGAISYRGIHWWPLPEMSPSTDIPSEIAGAFTEAATAFAANCPRASAVMARCTLEAITVEKGETKGSLAECLRVLATKGVLQPALADWAKEVRLVGNAGAHFDPLQPVTREDASQLLAFVRELLKYLYELPAELERRRLPKGDKPGPSSLS
jgi:hypothetical protein